MLNRVYLRVRRDRFAYLHSNFRASRRGRRDLNYRSKRITRSSTELLFVIDTSSTKERVQTISFRVKDGVVTRVSQKTEAGSADVDF